MNRLTNEFVLSNIENGFHLDDEHIKFVKDKLEYADKMKSIEKQLGCPLDVVFKALMNGIWYEDVANRMTHIGVGLDTANYDCEYLLREYDNIIRFLPRNYKKTWWLSETKEE